MPELERFLSLEDAKLRQELVSLQWKKTDIKALHFLEKRYDPNSANFSICLL